MKTRQITKRILMFEEFNEGEIYDFVKLNFELIEKFTLGFSREISTDTKKFLLDSGFSLLLCDNLVLNEKPESNNADSNKAQDNTQIIHKVRSGEEIITESSIMLLGDVANGATIRAYNVSVFGNVSGIIEANGEFIVLKKLISGRLVLQDEVLDSLLVNKINENDCLKIVIKNGSKISIKTLT